MSDKIGGGGGNMGKRSTRYLLGSFFFLIMNVWSQLFNCSFEGFFSTCYVYLLKLLARLQNHQ